MAEDVVIRAEGLGKKYIIGHENVRERYTTLRDVAASTARDLWHRATDVAYGRAIIRGTTTEEFWALKDVSFEVKRGEVLGIVGRNGAGKSTLLKILSRITEPSQGSVTIEDRVASLLEVGTGFHPELTGRENIYLNGAVLGMTQAEIRRKFDEIVDFSEVEKFLDTPVKRYSSGMYVRLAFAVAAHLEPEILIVDEVLAVGDAEFQKKCLSKISKISSGGRTVLFVSHNMAAIGNLCSEAIHLDGGSIKSRGLARQVVSSYLVSHAALAERRWSDDKAPGDNTIRLRKVWLANELGQTMDRVLREQAAYIHLEYEIFRRVSALEIGLRVSTADGTTVFTSSDSDGVAEGAPVRYPGTYMACCTIPPNLLTAQPYDISFGAHVPNAHVHFFEEAALTLTVVNNGSEGRSVDDGRRGVVGPILRWSVIESASPKLVRTN
jgi:lipopolysaccharide transport system ATP-binding protein